MILVAILKGTDKKAGSGAGSVSQRHGSKDPDPYPYQNVTDPKHSYKHMMIKDS
jgi:hypothetical protein